MKPIFKKIFVFSAVFFALCSAFSASISLQVFQKNPGQEKIWETSQIFEQSALDFFFESGYIVSNSPCFISTDERSDKLEINHSISDARAGQLEYYSEIALFFADKINSSSEDALLEHIKKVQWKIFDCKTGNVVFEGENVPEKITKKNNDEYGVILFAQEVALNIKSKLGKSGW